MAKSLVSCFLTHGVYCPNKIFAEAILSNSTRKLSWFEITKMLTAVSKKKCCVIYYTFRHTFVPYCPVHTGMPDTTPTGLSCRVWRAV